MTAVADTVALNMSYERASVNGLTDHDEQEASSKKHKQLKTRVLRPYQNGQNCDQKGWKTLPFRATHTYIAKLINHSARNNVQLFYISAVF